MTQMCRVAAHPVFTSSFGRNSHAECYLRKCKVYVYTHLWSGVNTTYPVSLIFKIPGGASSGWKTYTGIQAPLSLHM